MRRGQDVRERGLVVVASPEQVDEQRCGVLADPDDPHRVPGHVGGGGVGGEVQADAGRDEGHAGPGVRRLLHEIGGVIQPGRASTREHGWSSTGSGRWGRPG